MVIPENIAIQEGTVFNTKGDFSAACHQWAVNGFFSIRSTKSCTKKLYFRCKDAECGFRIRGSCRIADGKWVAYKIICDHSCASTGSISDSNSKVSFVSSRLQAVVNRDPNRKARSLITDLSISSNINARYLTVYRAKERALLGAKQKEREAYQLIPGFLQQVSQNHPDTVTDFQKDDNDHFVRMFVGLGEIKELLPACKPMIFIDATFIKNMFKGTLLLATILDANQHILILAYAICSKENADNWGWFVSKLYEMYGHLELTVMSDREKGKDIW